MSCDANDVDIQDLDGIIREWKGIPEVTVHDDGPKQTRTVEKQQDGSRMLRLLQEQSTRKVLLLKFECCAETMLRWLLMRLRFRGRTFCPLGSSMGGIRGSNRGGRRYYLEAQSFEEVEEFLETIGRISEIKTISKREARIALLFSEGWATKVALPWSEVMVVDDVEDNGHTFTDGCGTIGRELADRCFDTLPASEKARVPARYHPSIYQIRYMGCKGVVLRLRKGHGMTLRPSQVKLKPPHGGIRDDLARRIFETVVVVQFSRPYTYAYLNRQYITLLAALGVPTSSLLQLQSEYWHTVSRAAVSPEHAVLLLEAEGEIDDAMGVLADARELQTPRLSKKIRAICKRHRDREQRPRPGESPDEVKLRVFLWQSRRLFGVADVTGKLRGWESGYPFTPRRCDGHCFIRVTMRGEAVTLRGPVMVGRTPSYLLGDIRLLQAVDCTHWDPAIRQAVEELEEEGVVDCIVFPTTGSRPLADMMAGGDVDGDEFTVVWDSRVTDHLRTEQPYTYPAYASKTADPNGKLPMREQSARYLVKQGACGALTGRIDTLYRWWADRKDGDSAGKGARSRQCVQLGQLFSRAVDAAKSGETVKVDAHLDNMLPDGSEKNIAVDMELCWKQMEKVAERHLSGGDMDAEVINASCTIEELRALLEDPETPATSEELLQGISRWFLAQVPRPGKAVVDTLLSRIALWRVPATTLDGCCRQLGYDRFALPTGWRASDIVGSGPGAFHDERVTQVRRTIEQGDYNLYYKDIRVPWANIFRLLQRGHRALLLFSLKDGMLVTLEFPVALPSSAQLAHASGNTDVDIEMAGAVVIGFVSSSYALEHRRHMWVGSSVQFASEPYRMQIYHEGIGSGTFLYVKSAQERTGTKDVVSIDLTAFPGQIIRNRNHPRIAKEEVRYAEVFVSSSAQRSHIPLCFDSLDVGAWESDEDRDETEDLALASEDDAAIDPSSPDILQKLHDYCAEEFASCEGLVVMLDEVLASVPACRLSDLGDEVAGYFSRLEWKATSGLLALRCVLSCGASLSSLGVSASRAGPIIDHGVAVALSTLAAVSEESASTDGSTDVVNCVVNLLQENSLTRWFTMGYELGKHVLDHSFPRLAETLAADVALQYCVYLARLLAGECLDVAKQSMDRKRRSGTTLIVYFDGKEDDGTKACIRFHAASGITSQQEDGFRVGSHVLLVRCKFLQSHKDWSGLPPPGAFVGRVANISAATSVMEIECFVAFQALPLDLKICDQLGKQWQWQAIALGTGVALERSCLALPALPSAPVLDVLTHSWSSPLENSKVSSRGPPPNTFEVLNDRLLLGERRGGFGVRPDLASKLNVSQKSAVEMVRKKRVALVHGPPGTGKTFTAVAIMDMLIAATQTQQGQLHAGSEAEEESEDEHAEDPNQQSQEQAGGATTATAEKSGKQMKVLACAETNLAVDNLALRLLKERPGSLIVRIGSPGAIHPDLHHVCVDVMAADEEERRGRFAVGKAASRQHQKMLKTFKRAIASAEVIFATTAMVGCGAMQRVKKRIAFSHVLVDEATLCTETSLLPVLILAERLCLIGDPQQMAPSELGEASKGRSETLFHRLLPCMAPAFLDTQHRMHPRLADFPSRHFYSGRLKSGVAEQDRTFQSGLLADGIPACYIDSSGCEESESCQAGSFRHPGEAQLVCDIVRYLTLRCGLGEAVEKGGGKGRCGVPPQDIVVLTPYRAQRQLLQERLAQQRGCESVVVRTIDKFQGSEAEVIVFSLGRSNGVGFMDDPHRVNVLLTRARRAVFGVMSSVVFAGVASLREWMKDVRCIRREDLLAAIGAGEEARSGGKAHSGKGGEPGKGGRRDGKRDVGSGGGHSSTADGRGKSHTFEKGGRGKGDANRWRSDKGKGKRSY